MTANEAIAQFTASYDNAADEDVVFGFLSELEEMIYTEVVLDYAPIDTDYNGTLNGESVLIASGAYEALYRHWLTAQTALLYRETEQYVVSMQLFNSYYDKFVRHYAKTHTAAENYRFTGF